jgi:hypothetical protein
MRPLRLVSTAALALCVVACAAIWGFEDLKPAGGGGDGGPDGADGGDSSSSCSLDHPDDPGTTDPGGAINFLTAIDSFDIGTHRAGDGGADASRAIAYDLDGVCTCHGAGQESCIRTSDPQTCDDDRGRDDVGRTLLSTLQTFVDVDKFTSEGAGDRLREGRFGILIMVQGYNDLPDDPELTVYILPSFGLGPVDGGVLDKNTTLPPTFTKNDTWTFDPRFGSKLNQDQIIGSGANVTGARKAYVRNGRLVARFDDLFIMLQLLVTNDNPLQIHISDAIATAKIKKTNGLYQLDDGRISGRWATGDLLRAIGTWELGSPLPGPLCFGSPGAYPTVKPIACAKRDIMARGSAPPLKCDALSFGLGFTSKPASVGNPAGYPFKTTACFDGSSPTTLDNYPDNCP